MFSAAHRFNRPRARNPASSCPACCASRRVDCFKYRSAGCNLPRCMQQTPMFPRVRTRVTSPLGAHARARCRSSNAMSGFASTQPIPRVLYSLARCTPSTRILCRSRSLCPLSLGVKGVVDIGASRCCLRASYCASSAAAADMILSTSPDIDRRARDEQTRGDTHTTRRVFVLPPKLLFRALFCYWKRLVQARWADTCVLRIQLNEVLRLCGK